MIKKSTDFYLKIPLFLSDFNKTRILSKDFPKIFKYQTSWKASSGCQVVPCGRTGGQEWRNK